MPTCNNAAKLIGVIEGFYGRCWSWSQRAELIDLLPSWQMNAYIYAPKSDLFLRRKWREDWDAETWAQLVSLSQRAKAHKVCFGVGLSVLDYCPSDEVQLLTKLERLNQLQLGCLGIFFDDMRGDDPNLAEQQIAAVAQIKANSNAQQLFFCPTYYSFDPVLEKVFGACPTNYLPTLAAQIPPEIAMFWTGNWVCSPSITSEDLSAAANKLGRLPAVWDNYPVNDGRVTSNFLHLAPFSQRAVAEDFYAAYFINPMNQFELSLPVLATAVQAIHGEGEPKARLRAFVAARWGEAFAQVWTEFAPLVQELGLISLPVEIRQAMEERLELMDNAAANEWLDWLRGGYVFDPACLTE